MIVREVEANVRNVRSGYETLITFNLMLSHEAMNCALESI